MENLSTEKILDIDYLMHDLCYSEDFLKSVLELAQRTFQTDIATLQKAYTEKNIAGIREMAHKLSGAAIYSGLMRLRVVCRELEFYLHQNDSDYSLAKITELYETILQEYDAAKEAIKSYLS